MSRRGTWVYGVLLTAWALLVAWQVGEHIRVRKSAKAELLNRTRDISTTVGVVLRSQRHFGVISKERLESALTDLVKPGELSGVAILNAAGDVVASAGTMGDFFPRAEGRTAEYWDNESVTVINLVDLGTSVTPELERTNPAIVMSFSRPSGTNRSSSSPGGFRREPPPPPTEKDEFSEAAPPPPTVSTNRFGRRGEGGSRMRFTRPFWMSEDEFKTMIQKQGVHSFVIELSTQTMRQASRNDFWMRSIIIVLATISVVGSGLAMRNLGKSSELEVRLVRARQQNLHLKEMNLAAAGLAHETRNPLNIVRGLAQIISKREDVASDIRDKTRQIVDESDRVTAQLNEFINYSRPREVRRANVSLSAVVGEVTRALSSDIEEKRIRLNAPAGPITIAADEQMLRQALFNLLLNATQAVSPGGEIHIAASRNGSEAALEVRDNGPGVPPERREEIFKPYFTTNEKGTGLGLAVVQQIVLAHGWEIDCRPNEPRGAVFRITHLKLAG